MQRGLTGPVLETGCVELELENRVQCVPFQLSLDDPPICCTVAGTADVTKPAKALLAEAGPVKNNYFATTFTHRAMPKGHKYNKSR